MTSLQIKLGLIAIVALTTLLSWWGFSSYYERKGVEKCQNEQAAAQAKANVEAIAAQNERDSTSSTVAADVRESAQKAVTETDTKTQTRQREIRDEYRKPAQVVAACTGVAAVPERVQDSIDSAVREANAAAR